MSRKHLLLGIVGRAEDIGKKRSENLEPLPVFDRWVSGAQHCFRDQNKVKQGRSCGFDLDFLVEFHFTQEFVGDSEEVEK